MPLVLVTSASGYLASTIAVTLLRAGHHVRATMRSQAKVEAFRNAWPQYQDQLQFVLVEDMAVEGCYDEACEGVDWIAHSASPFLFGYTDNEEAVLKPAINGTLNLLTSATKSSTVKRVVITSSFAAMQDYSLGNRPSYVYSSKDWSPLTYEDGKNSKDQLEVYLASKKLSEEAAWKFVEEKKPGFTLSTICPTYIMGYSPPPLSKLNELSTSAAFVRDLIDAKSLPHTPLPAMNDVWDTALAHVRALERDIAQGKRYFLVAHEWSSSMVAHILREQFPEHAHRIPESKNEKPDAHFGWDVEETVKDLGIEWTLLEETIRASGAQVFELEKQQAEIAKA